MYGSNGKMATYSRFRILRRYKRIVLLLYRKPTSIVETDEELFNAIAASRQISPNLCDVIEAIEKDRAEWSDLNSIDGDYIAIILQSIVKRHADRLPDIFGASPYVLKNEYRRIRWVSDAGNVGKH